MSRSVRTDRQASALLWAGAVLAGVGAAAALVYASANRERIAPAMGAGIWLCLTAAGLLSAAGLASRRRRRWLAAVMAGITLWLAYVLEPWAVIRLSAGMAQWFRVKFLR